MKEINYVIWQEGKYYVAQCLNVDVSSFGETIEEAIKNIKEAVELYFEKENIEVLKIDKVWRWFLNFKKFKNFILCNK